MCELVIIPYNIYQFKWSVSSKENSNFDHHYMQLQQGLSKVKMNTKVTATHEILIRNVVPLRKNEAPGQLFGLPFLLSCQLKNKNKTRIKKSSHRHMLCLWCYSFAIHTDQICNS